MEMCKGNGECIISFDNSPLSCLYDCKPKYCLNSLVCNSNQLKDVMLGDLCFGCDIRFAKPLNILSDTLCSVCRKNGPGVKRINCEHIMCLSCFKHAYYGEDVERPVFPYSKKVEIEYLENKCENKWANDILIIKYEAEYETWIHILEEVFRKNEVLRKCKECGS